MTPRQALVAAFRMAVEAIKSWRSGHMVEVEVDLGS